MVDSRKDGEYQDYVVINLAIDFDWKERLRILFGRTVKVHNKTLTENPVGKIQCSTEVYVEPIFSRRNEECLAEVSGNSAS